MEIKSIKQGKNDSQTIQSGIVDLYGSKQCRSSTQITAWNPRKIKPFMLKSEIVWVFAEISVQRGNQ